MSIPSIYPDPLTLAVPVRGQVHREWVMVMATAAEELQVLSSITVCPVYQECWHTGFFVY